MIKCIVNNKIYIGQAVQVLVNGEKWGTHGRWLSHIREANSHQNHCVALDNAIRKHGVEKFKVETLLIGDSKMADFYEILFIAEYQTIGKFGYNLTTGGSKGRDSDITRKRKSDARLGRVKPPESRRRMSIGQIGNRRTVKVRKHAEDSELPKYICAHRPRQGIIVGYCVKHFPIGNKEIGKLYIPTKYFTSPLLTLDQKLRMSIDFLDNLKRSYP